MGDSLEDLLAQLKAKYQAGNQPDDDLPPAATPAPAKPEASYPQSSRSASSQPGSIDDLLSQIEGKPPVSPSSNLPFPPATAPSTSSPSPDALLNDLKKQYQEQDQSEALKRQEQERAEKLRHEQLLREKRIQVTKQAEAWLKALDPRSGEAAWFEEFASKYESRVDAAIDYLNLLAEP